MYNASNLRRNVAAMFFAIVFSTATVAAAVGPAHVSSVFTTVA